MKHRASQSIEPNLRKLLITAVAYLSNTAIGTAIAVHENLLAEFARAAKSNHCAG